jgi:hypothetical protein
MAVTAEFRADTSSFVKEVEKAEKALDGLGKSTDTLQKQVGAFDSVLQKAGINIGPTAKAIDEISAASGKTAGELGKLATAGLVVGTAMAAWDFGRAIAGFFGLDKAIGNATAAALGWGDISKEVAGAQQDVIDAAFKNSKGVLMSYSQALAYNTKFHQDRLAAVKETNQADIASGEAWAELNSIGATYTETLATMNQADVAAIKLQLAQNAQVSTLAAAYGYTASQIKAVEESMKAAEAADKAWLEGMKAADAEATLYAATLTNVLQKAIKDTADLDEKATIKLTAMTDARTASIMKEQAARDIIAAKSAPQYDAQTTAWMKMQKSLGELQKEQVGNIDTTARQAVIYSEYTDATLAEALAQDEATQAFWKSREAQSKNTEETEKATKATGVYMNQLHMLVDDPKLAAFFGGNAVANTLYSGGQGGFTPEEAAAIGAGQFINMAGVGQPGLGQHPIIVNVNSPLGTPAQVGAAVGNALTGQARANGARF